MSQKLINDFYFSDQPLGSSHNKHKHNVYQMIYIVEGSMSCEIAGNRIDCSAPSVVFIGNYEPHIISKTSERYVRYVLTMDPYMAGSTIKPALLASVFSFHPSGFAYALDVTEIDKEIRVLVEELYREYTLPMHKKLPEGEELLLSALLYRIRQFSPSHFTSKNFGSAEMTVASVRMELENNLAQKLDLNMLASTHHISRYYLAHIFREVTGYSLKEYLMLCRISYACQQLAECDKAVGEIAEASGFHDMSNFSRSFKEIIGISPSEFRKRTRR